LRAELFYIVVSYSMLLKVLSMSVKYIWLQKINLLVRQTAG